MSEVTDRDFLDLLLADSVPQTSEMTPDVVRQLDLLVAESAPSEDRRARRRSWRRPLAAGLMSVLVLGGVATAAAAATGVWPLWAETPDAVAQFALPSGAQCEYRLGNVQGHDPAAVQLIRDHYRSLDTSELLEPENVTAMIERIRIEEAQSVSRDSGYQSLSADSAYRIATWRLLHEGLESKIADAGIASDAAQLMSNGQLHCPGAQW